jgi:transposase
VVIEDDPEKRIAELERQLAEVKATLRGAQGVTQPPQFSDAQTGAAPDSADERARRHAQALWDGLRSSQPSGPDEPSGPEIAQLREALMHAAAAAGMSQAQIDDVLQRGQVTIKSGHSVVYSGQDGPQHFGGTPAGVDYHSAYPQTGLRQQAGMSYQRPRRKLSGADRVGAIVGMIGGMLGLCVGGAAALTAVFPSTAMWMSGIVCRSPYHLASSTSRYSYKPGQSGTSVNYQCISDAAGWYEVNTFAIIGLQSLLAAFIVCAVVGVVRLIRRRAQHR